MKRVLSVLLALCLMLGAVPVFASAADDDFVIDENGMLTEYNGLGGEVTVPSSVRAIATGVFSDSNITSLTLPNVTYLDVSALSCSTLKTVYILSTSLTYQEYAFASSLEDIYFGGTQEVFKSQYGFPFISSSTRIHYNYKPTAAEDFVIDENGKLIAYNGPGGDVVIPDGVTEVDMSIFGNKTDLEFTCLTIPGTAKTVSSSELDSVSYTGLSNVKEIVLEEGVTTIAPFAFAGGSHLEKITIPSTVTSIQLLAFATCPDMEINYGGTVAQWKAIDINLDGGEGLFRGSRYYSEFFKYSTIRCTDGVIHEDRPEFQVNKEGRLYRYNGPGGAITLPNTIKSLGFYGGTLASNSTITEITFPTSLTDMVVYLEGDRTSGENVNSCAFMPNLKKVTFPEGCKVLGVGLLSSCPKLEVVYLPSTIKHLSCAFTNCPSLKDIYYNGTRAQWNKMINTAQPGVNSSVDTVKNVTIHCTDDGVTPPTPPKFTDVPSGAYFAQPVAWAIEKGITKGKGAGTFKPADPCTRAEIVTFLHRALGKPAAGSSASFTDMPTNKDFVGAINWAVAKGVTKGKGPGTFQPNATCTRAEAVTFIWRALGKPTAPATTKFTDMPGNADFQKAISWAVANKVTTGKTGSTFAPNDTCNRGEIVTFLHRAMK